MKRKFVALPSDSAHRPWKKKKKKKKKKSLSMLCPSLSNPSVSDESCLTSSVSSVMSCCMDYHTSVSCVVVPPIKQL
ncbi:hypothetical protein SOVF_035010 [Spinacia oleracea]|nr:hypothetical protein SOVF_035010 [Spinacia oleracea]